MMKRNRSCVLALCVAAALGAASLGGCSVGEALHEGVTAVAESASKAARFDVSGTIEQTTMLDNDVLTVVAESLEYRNDVAYLKLSLTNNTEGTIDVTACTGGYDANYVNDCMLSEGYFSCEIPAGETAEDEVDFSLQELQLYGIQKISVLGLGLRVVDEEYDELFKDMVEVKTSLYGSEGVDSSTFAGSIDSPALAEKLEYEFKAASTTAPDLAETDIEIPAAFLFINKDGDIAVMAELRNNTEETLRVQVGNITINGLAAYEGESWSGGTVAAGKRGVMSLRLSSVVEYGDLLFDSSKAAEDADSTEGKEGVDLSNVKEIGMTISTKDANGNTISDPVDVAFAF